MTDNEFIQYENKHVQFRLKNNSEYSGVLTRKFAEAGKSDTIYDFVPSRNMIDWQKAEQKKDKEAMKTLQGEIDIADIIWLQKHNH